MLFTMWFWTFIVVAIVSLYYRDKILFKRGLISNNRSHGPGSYITLSFGRTHYYLSGPEGGEVVVFLHGYSVPSEVYLEVGLDQYYVNEGFRFLTFDFYGRGYSDAPDTKYTPAFLAGQIAELLYALDIHEPVSIIGVSMAGGIGSYFTKVYPERVKKLILLSSIGYEILVPKVVFNLVQVPVLGEILFKLIGKSVLYKAYPTEWVNPSTEDFKKCFERVKKHAIENVGLLRSLFLTLKFFPLYNISDIISEVAKLEKKVLIIHGDKDNLIPYNSALRTSREIETSSLLNILGGKHGVVVENKDEIHPKIVTFIKG